MLEKLRVSPPAFERFAWGVLGYTVLVILWGALVRATGSGAGCGDHWPLCNGAVVPREPALETLIEFTHRATSGLALIAVLAMTLAAFASFDKGAPVRRAAVASSVFMILEAIIGAGIVLFRLVADDQSIVRGVSMSLHLVNTFLLLGALTVTAWWTRHEAPARSRLGGPLAWAAGLGFLLLGFVGMTGAIAALGDTLFPTPSYAASHQGANANALVEETRHLFLRLRVWHPVVSIVGALWWAVLAHVASLRSDDETTRRAALVVFVTTVLQLGLGVINVALRAPVWMQLVHLFVANVIVVAAVVFASELLLRGLAPRAAWQRA